MKPPHPECTSDTPKRFDWKRVLKFTAGAGAIWITIEVLIAIGLIVWLAN